MADPELFSTPRLARRRVELFGVGVDALTLSETVAEVRSIVEARVPMQHVVVNAAKLVETSKNPALRNVVNECALINADGMSVVWAGRILGRVLPERVTGIDLFERLVAVACEDGKSVYFLGATEAVVEGMVREFRKRYAGLRVAGYRNGYWDDDRLVVEHVRAAHPDYLFLAIPSPRKEFWLSEHLQNLGVPFVMGVGGSFDVIAGKTPRAPVWMQRVGLEWFWRFVREPRRLWRRYLSTNTQFIVMTAREWWRTGR